MLFPSEKERHVDTPNDSEEGEKKSLGISLCLCFSVKPSIEKERETKRCPGERE